MSLQLCILSIFTGAVVGLIFGLLKLPIPAPGVFEGVLGIVGVWFGGAIIAPWVPRLILIVQTWGEKVLTLLT